MSASNINSEPSSCVHFTLRSFLKKVEVENGTSEQMFHSQSGWHKETIPNMTPWAMSKVMTEASNLDTLDVAVRYT